MRLVFVTFAAHATTDNVLISTPACVFFAFIAAIYAEADDAASKRLRTVRDGPVGNVRPAGGIDLRFRFSRGWRYHGSL